MNKLMVLVALVVMSGETGAEELPLALHVLPNGNARFGDGPELDDVGLHAEIQRMMKLSERPRIQLLPERTSRFADVARVLRDFQQSGYGARFGFTGIAQ